MRNFYEALGISADSTQETIKKAYRTQARLYHPDKGGDSERMKLINTAYDTLSDPTKRQAFDEVREYFYDDEPENTDDVVHEYLSAAGVPYSQEYRERHTRYRHQFMQKPLIPGSVGTYVSEPDETIYEPSLLEALFKTLVSDINKIAPAHPCIKAITDTLVMIENGECDIHVLFTVVTEITALAKTQYKLPACLIVLFQHDAYRQLCQYVFQVYWHDKALHKPLLHVDGRDETKALLDDLKERLHRMSESGEINRSLKSVTQAVRLLLHFEKSLHEKKQKASSAKEYREIAFHILDWIPAFEGKMPPAMLANFLLQAGNYFLLASKTKSAIKRKDISKSPLRMADEKLAQEIYITILSIGHHATPDIELHHYLHAINSMMRFQFVDESLGKLIVALQQRALLLVDVFPFCEEATANIHFLMHDNKLLDVMRDLLHHLVDVIDAEKFQPEETQVQHASTAVVLHQAHAACLKGWYEEPYDADTEYKIRLDLMRTLLEEQGWDFVDIEDNVAFTSTRLGRDTQGWLEPSSLWDVSPDADDYLSSVDGLIIDHNSGSIKLLVTQCDRKTPDCFRVLSKSDLVELIQKNITGAIFSLDPVDSNMDYHPFNAMRFAPTRLSQTRFLETLLATDYLLKFFTVGQEVQGVYPFDVRPLAALNRNLPAYLQKIIDDFQHAQTSESLHRFWIEADALAVAFDHSQLESNGKQTIHLYDVNMVVKKHLMERDAEGNLVDATERHEGWYFYVLTKQLKKAFNLGQIKVAEPALLFLWEGCRQFYCVEAGEQDSFELHDFDDPLKDLRECPRTQDGKVIENTRSLEIIYRITREFSRQTEKPHHFSPEYVFAQEFSAHYEEFALYLPEFKRLQELSRVVVLVRLLSGVRAGNEEAIAQIRSELSGIDRWKDTKMFSPGSEDKAKYEEVYNSIFQSLQEQFSQWRSQTNYCNMVMNKEYELRDKLVSIKNQCHSFNYYRPQIKSELIEAFAEMSVNHTMIDDFLDGYVYPLAEAIVNHQKKQIHQNIRKALSTDLTCSQIGEALNRKDWPIHHIAKKTCDEQFAKYLNDKRQQLRKQLNQCERLGKEFKELGLGANEKEISLLGECLWVPANINHQHSVANNHSRFVYGGVSVQPNIVRTNQVIRNSNQGTLSGRQLNAANGNAGRGGASGGGANGGGSGGGPGGNGRFTILANGIPRAEARSMLRGGSHNLTPEQVAKVGKVLGSGRSMETVTIKHMNTGEVRVFGVRPGHTDGYQRLSVGINTAGQTTKVVQTAFDNNNNLVRQKPGQNKNNLYDVKNWNV